MGQNLSKARPESNGNDSPKRLRILLADDHALLRSGIRALIERFDFAEVVGEAGDGREALEQAAALRPDIILMDIGMAGLNGLEAASRVATECPGVKVIILSMYDEEDYVLRAFRSGAAGYLLKAASVAELEVALQTVARGQTYLSSAISRHVIDRRLKETSGFASPFDQLTARQREVMQLLAEGKSTKETAYLLNLSAKTVETHRAQLMKRLAIRDISGLVRYAIRAGLIQTQ